MKYKLCIEGDSGRINITDETVIRSINIRISQSDQLTNARGAQLFGDLVIQGVLNEKSQQETKELFEWSMKTDKASVYKTVSIQAYKDEKLFRDYYLKEMYCTSYEENFDVSPGVEGSNGTFVLKMRQQQGAIGTIVVSCE